jgi:3-oxoacyl-[acyl-carrier protein] reductase
VTAAGLAGIGGGFDLRGRRALVTGGSSGTGRAAALILAAAGARVVVGAEPGDPEADGLAIDLKEIGDDHLVVTADLANEVQVIALVEACRSHLGGLDIVVHVAGAGDADAPTASDGGFDRVVNGTLRTAYLLIRHVAAMLPPGSAVVAVAESGAAGVHAATVTAGLSGLTRSFATELGPDGIRVNLVAAAPADPAQIAALVAFLAGPGAAGVTGETIPAGGAS